jgi:beta-galactosidase
VTYLGFMPSEILIEKLMTEAVTRAGLSTPAQQAHFPWIVRSGTYATDIKSTIF